MKTTNPLYKLGLQLGTISHPPAHIIMPNKAIVESAVLPTAVVPKQPMALDMSKWDPVADYTAINPRPALVYLRATYGAGYLDPLFVTHVHGFQRIGVPLTAYHFFLYTEDAIKQAAAFVSQVNLVGGAASMDFPVVLDIEGNLPAGMTPQQAQDALGSWIYEVHKRLGMGVSVYSSAYYFQKIYVNGKPPTWATSPDPFTGHKPYFAWAGYPTDPNNVATMPSTYRAPGIDSSQDWLWQYTTALYITGIQGAQDGNQVLQNISEPPAPPIPTEPPTAVSGIPFGVVVDSLNVRSGPSTNSTVVGTLHGGDVIIAKDVSGTDAWVQIDYNGGLAWVAVKVGSTTYMRKVN